MGWKTLQSVDEVAKAMLTHQCRHRPGLKLRPEHCDSYRGAQSNPRLAGLSSDAVLCHQWQCPGPVPIDYATSTEGTCDIKQAEVQVAEKVVMQKNGNKELVRVKRLKGDATCRVCGRKNGDAEFYPTRPEMCVDCIKQQVQNRRKGAVAIAERFVQSKQPKHKYVCAEHGPHDGRFVGKNHLDMCPECYKKRISEGIKNKTAGITKNSLTLPEWLVAWASEHGCMLGMNANDFITDKLAPLVDADWLKEWVVKNKGKIV